MFMITARVTPEMGVISRALLPGTRSFDATPGFRTPDVG